MAPQSWTLDAAAHGAYDAAVAAAERNQAQARASQPASNQSTVDLTIR